MAEKVQDIEQTTEKHDIPSEATEKPGSSRPGAEDSSRWEWRPTYEIYRNIETERVVVLSFRSLPLMRIAELQDELIRLSDDTFGTTNETWTDRKELVDRALRDYANALQTYEIFSLNDLSTIPPGSRFIGSLAGRSEPPRQGFLGLFSSRIFTPVKERFFPPKPDPTRIPMHNFKLMEKMRNKRSQPSNVAKRMQSKAGNLGFRELDQRGRILRQREKAFTERIVMALFGGIALIGPMLIMTLHKSQNTSLITVSIATFVFALVLAVGATNSAGKDVLGATAAYAAVLVVFVGTSS